MKLSILSNLCTWFMLLQLQLTRAGDSSKSFHLCLNTGSDIYYERHEWLDDSPYTVGGDIFTADGGNIDDLLMRSERYWKSSKINNHSGMYIPVPFEGMYNVILYASEQSPSFS